jgi:hypothetical protein
MDPVVRRVDCVHYPKCLMRACKHNEREGFNCLKCRRYVKDELDFFEAWQQVQCSEMLIEFVLHGRGSPQDKRRERCGRKSDVGVTTSHMAM